MKMSKKQGKQRAKQEAPVLTLLSATTPTAHAKAFAPFLAYLGLYWAPALPHIYLNTA